MDLSSVNSAYSTQLQSTIGMSVLEKANRQSVTQMAQLLDSSVVPATGPQASPQGIGGNVDRFA